MWRGLPACRGVDRVCGIPRLDFGVTPVAHGEGLTERCAAETSRLRPVEGRKTASNSHAEMRASPQHSARMSCPAWGLDTTRVGVFVLLLTYETGSATDTTRLAKAAIPLLVVSGYLHELPLYKF